MAAAGTSSFWDAFVRLVDRGPGPNAGGAEPEPEKASGS